MKMAEEPARSCVEFGCGQASLGGCGDSFFLLIAPGPFWICTLVDFSLAHSRSASAFAPFRWLGVLLILRRSLLLDSFARFALKGLERRAPFSPRGILGSAGFYR